MASLGEGKTVNLLWSNPALTKHLKQHFNMLKIYQKKKPTKILCDNIKSMRKLKKKKQQNK